MGPQTLKYGDNSIPYEVSIRPGLAGKIAIHVHPDGTVEVDAPEKTTAAAIRTAVRKRARWITSHLEKIHERQRDVLPRHYVSGESHFYLGRRYLLKVIDLTPNQVNDGTRPCVKLKGGQLQVSVDMRDADYIKKLVTEWYRAHARNHFERRLTVLSERVSWVGKMLPTIKLINMKKNWGSCSPTGSLVLNPHLVKAPSECIDYVILHELCHLKEHNHSKRFFRLMDRVCQNWPEAKRRLDDKSELYLNG